MDQHTGEIFFVICNHPAIVPIVIFHFWVAVQAEEGFGSKADEWAGKAKRQWKQRTPEGIQTMDDMDRKKDLELNSWDCGAEGEPVLLGQGSPWATLGVFFFVFWVFFFFAFPSYISGVHHFWVRFLRMWPFFNPTIKVVTFRLRGWCVLGVFLLPAFTRLGHERQDLLSPCDEMHVCTD